MSTQKRFVFVILSIGLISALCCALLLPLVWGKYAAANTHTMGVSIAFSVISLANGLLLFRYVNKRPQLFVRAFMGSMTIKFVAYLILMAIMALNFRIYLVPIVVIFFILFVIYTVVEKVMIFKAFNENQTS
jgi:hypothetical protein